MDRKQKIEKTARDRKVSKVSNVIAHPKYLNPDYGLEQCDGILSETGQLHILKVVSKCGTGPYFVVRWDQVPEHLDVDMYRASRSAIRNSGTT